MVRVMGRVVKELIENDKVKSYSSKSVGKLESEELKRNYRLEKRRRKKEVDIDQKLERLKENS